MKFTPNPIIFKTLLAVGGFLGPLFVWFWKVRDSQHREMYNHYQKTKDDDFSTVIASLAKTASSVESLKDGYSTKIAQDRELADKHWKLNTESQKENQKAIMHKINTFTHHIEGLYEIKAEMLIGERNDFRENLGKISKTVEKLGARIDKIIDK